MSEYSWYPSITAPDVAPMRVINAQFTLRDQCIMRVPEGKILCHTWGLPVTIFLLGETGNFALPESLNVLCFSYLEDCFYKGVVQLPETELTGLWDMGLLHPDTHEKKNFESFVIGLAPQGYVQIWLYGYGVSRSLCSGQLEKVNYSWDKFINNPDISRSEYVNSVLKDKLGDEKLMILRADKLILSSWKRKANKFNWIPQVTSQLANVSSWINYVNGDLEYVSWDHEFRNFNDRALPESIQIRFMTDDGKAHLVNANLSPELFTNAMKSLNGSRKNKPLVMHLIIPAIEKQLFVYLSNENTYISLNPEAVRFYTV